MSCSPFLLLEMQLRSVSGHSMQPGCAKCSPPNLRLTPAVENCRFLSVTRKATVRGLRSRRAKALHTSISAHSGVAATSKVDIDVPYRLRDSDTQFYRSTGFVKLKNVFDGETLSHYAPAMSLEVRQADKTPRQQDPDYQQAFTQVQNLRKQNNVVAKFVMGQKLARIAAELMGVEGVRVYADQALYKEPHGGYTPWHCDAFYWPLATDKAITAWIPLQATPEEMGPMQFAAGSHSHDLGRHLEIGRESHKLIDAKVQQGGFEVVSEPYQFGEVSFHSSLNFHKANGNETDRPREVFTIMFMDKDMTLAEPLNEYQHLDRDAYFPDLLPGQLCDTEHNPIVWSSGK